MSNFNRFPGYKPAMRGLLAGIGIGVTVMLGVVGVNAVLTDYAQRTEVTPWAGPEVNVNAPGVASRLIGKTVDEAEQIITQAGLVGRIASVDGVPNILTADFEANRINLTIVNGIVTGTTLG